MSTRPRLSVVIPVYDEEENLPELQRRLEASLGALGTYEIVYVDDGSRDRSVELIRGFHAENPAVVLLRLSRNFGHQAALSAGLDAATGDAVVFMDADLQDPPELLTELVARWEEGAEVVYAVRAHRAGSKLKRAGYWSFYRLYRFLADVDMPLDSGDFCLIDRQVADVVRALPERNRLLRGLRTWVGFEQVGVPYDRPERFAGEPKYSFKSLVKLALDGLLSFSSMPLRVASLLGLGVALAGVIYTLFAVAARLFTGSVPEGWTSIVAIFLTVSGVQLLMIGVVGEYLARVYTETKRRPVYIVRERVGGDRGDGDGSGDG